MKYDRKELSGRRTHLAHVLSTVSFSSFQWATYEISLFDRIVDVLPNKELIPKHRCWFIFALINMAETSKSSDVKHKATFESKTRKHHDQLSEYLLTTFSVELITPQKEIKCSKFRTTVTQHFQTLPVP